MVKGCGWHGIRSCSTARDPRGGADHAVGVSQAARPQSRIQEAVLPPAELYLMTDDVAATVAALQAEGIEVARPISDQGWGLLTAMTLPGGVELGLYQPQHPTAAQPA
jgi:hypothetical protein